MLQQKEKTQSEKANELQIDRLINAPIDLVFAAWTDPEHLKHWMAPRGCTIHFKQIDIRQGGGFLSCVKNPSYPDCWAKANYLNITKPSTISYRIELSDENGNLDLPRYKALDFPAVSIITVSFTKEGDKTRILLHQTVSEEAAKTKGAYQSWLQSLDILEEHLNSK